MIDAKPEIDMKTCIVYENVTLSFKGRWGLRSDNLTQDIVIQSTDSQTAAVWNDSKATQYSLNWSQWSLDDRYHSILLRLEDRSHFYGIGKIQMEEANEDK